MANATAIQAANTNRAASRALQAEASDIRASAESYSATTSPTIRAMREAAVFHASRATDRAFHERSPAGRNRSGGMPMTREPTYAVRDGLLFTTPASGLSRAEAGRIATELTREAGNRGERAATPSGADRFTVERER